jgi:RNA polymerase sigma-70 factor, ECF subfamily
MAGTALDSDSGSPQSGVRTVHCSFVACEVSSFESIYTKYFDFVWSSVRRLGVSSAATDDVVQEVFIVIHSRLYTLEHPQALRSWIYGIVRRTVSGYHRSRRVKEASGAGLAAEPNAQPLPSTPADLVEQNDKVKLLFILLEELDEPKREVFMMAELAELTVPNIAEILEIPLNTAYSRLRAARQAFEQALVRHAARREREGRR